MKIGIQTYHAAYNVGAMLQAFATVAALKKLGHEAQLIDYYTPQLEHVNELSYFPDTPRRLMQYLNGRLNFPTIRRLRRFRKFRRIMPLTRRYRSFDELKNAPPECDLYLSGSDQIWNVATGFDPVYFLRYLPPGKRKASYGSSFGRESFSDEQLKLIGELLADYRSIGVRETSGAEIVRLACGREAAVVLDPTFLLSGPEWEKMADGAERCAGVPAGDYWYMSQLEFTEANRENVSTVKRRLAIPCVEYTPKIVNPRREVYSVHDAGPLEFMDLIRNARFVCTSSFHTMAFAIHFHKDFYVVRHSNGRNTRMQSLLEQLGLGDRLVDRVPGAWEPIDYSAVDERRRILVKKSYDYLSSISK